MRSFFGLWAETICGDSGVLAIHMTALPSCDRVFHAIAPREM
jgi:hypothetical protein